MCAYPDGACTFKDGKCVVGSDADCQALPACWYSGKCTFKDGACVK